MSQSLACIPIHFIWSTRDRQPFVKPEIEKELFSYMASIFRAHESPALTINGAEDHVHVLSILSRKITTAKLIEEVKKGSSKWIKTKGRDYQNFYWQSGYAALGVGQSNTEALKRYIADQKERHRKKTFQRFPGRCPSLFHGAPLGLHHARHKWQDRTGHPHTTNGDRK